MTDEQRFEMLQIFRGMLADKHIYIFEKRRTGKVMLIYHIKVFGIHNGVWDFTPLLLHLLNIEGDDLKVYSKKEFVKQVCKALQELGYPLPGDNYEIISDNIRWLE
jgi:hypothetical protein